MALAFYFNPSATAAMSAAKYDECIRRLDQAGARHPRGRVYHAAFGTSDNLVVFDVWTSQAAFDAFGRTLMPILQELGIDAGQPGVMDVHNVIVPPAPARRAPARGGRKQTARRAASRKPARRPAAKKAGRATRRRR